MTACRKPNLALINQVKTQESRWTDLHEKLGKVERDLTQTAKKYPEHFMDLRKYALNPKDLPDSIASSKNSTFDLQYKKMSIERTRLEVQYATLRNRFNKDINVFNDWQNKLMKNKLSESDAKKTFGELQKNFQTLNTETDSLQVKLIRNIRLHNTLTRDYAVTVGNFNNFNIEPN